MAIPEFEMLRKLRDLLARSGLRPFNPRTPEDHARVAIFETTTALMRFLEVFKHKVEAGEQCGMRCVRHSPKPGRLLIEIVIDMQA